MTAFPSDIIHVRKRRPDRTVRRETWEQFRLFDNVPQDQPAPPNAPANDLDRQVRDTPPGMAAWAGTGPADRTCEQCRHFHLRGYATGWCKEFNLPSANLLMMSGPILGRFDSMRAVCSCMRRSTCWNRWRSLPPALSERSQQRRKKRSVRFAGSANGAESELTTVVVKSKKRLMNVAQKRRVPEFSAKTASCRHFAER
jgi:hypothetical protein